MFRRLVILIGAAVWMFSGALRADDSPAIQDTSQEMAQTDPALWGVYSELVGTSRQAGERGYRVTWRWGRPGEEMLEQWSVPTTGETKYTHKITLGAQAGQLVFVATGMLGGTWDGTVQADGGVLYIGRGRKGSSHHVGLAADGYYEQRRATVKDGQIVSLAKADEYTRFALVDGQAPALTASTPNRSAQRIVPSVADAPIDPHADPAIWGHYAHIVGREWRGYYDISVRWSTPGKEIVEEWKYGPMTPLSAGKTLRTIVIRPGNKPGRLRANISGSRLEGTYDGKVGKAGQVSLGPHYFKLLDANTIEYGGSSFGSYYEQRVFAASSNAGAAPPQRDTWGAYIDLAGQSFQSNEHSMRLLMSFDWLIPGEVFYVLQHFLDDDMVYGELIHVSPEDGGLTARSSPPWNVHARGEIDANGKISFVTKRTLGMRGRSTFERLGTGQLEHHADHTLSSARTWLLSPVANEQVAQVRIAARRDKQQRDRAEAVAKAERSQRRAEFFGDVLSAAETFSQELSVAQASGGSADAQLGAATGRTLDNLRAQQQSSALAQQYRDDVSAAGSTSSASHSPSAGSAAFVDGTYAMQDGSYSLEARRDGADLVVTEPNKVSRYRPHSDGVWHFYNPNVDILYGMRVVDGRTLEAFKPNQLSVAPTSLYRVGGAAAVEIKTVNANTNAVANRYKQKANDDPDNVQVWSACALAAHKRATSPGPVADLYGMQMAQVLKEMMTDPSATPCSDAIPAELW